jgi:hypothetical protein
MKTKKMMFTRSDMAKACNVTDDTVRRWIDNKFVKAYQSGSRGIPHIFDFDELLRAAMFRKLTRIGLQKEEAAEFSKAAKSQWHEVENEGKSFLVFDLVHMKIRAACSLEDFEFSNPVHFLFKNGAQAVFIIDAKRVLNDLEEKIASL